MVVEDEYMVTQQGRNSCSFRSIRGKPRLKSNLFNQMEKMGLEPERYVVCGELNSLNLLQITSFLKKLENVKKLVKNVVKLRKHFPLYCYRFTMTPSDQYSERRQVLKVHSQQVDIKTLLKGITAGALGGFASGVSGGISSLRAGNTFMEGFKSSGGSAAGGVGERFRQFASPARAREAGGTYFGDQQGLYERQQNNKALISTVPISLLQINK